MKFYCAASSIQPIDLTALVYYEIKGIMGPQDTIIFEVADDEKIPVDPIHRLLYQPFTLPTPFLLLDEEVYRQIFWPTSNSPKETADAVREIISLQAQILGDEVGEGIYERGGRLINALENWNLSTDVRCLGGIAKHIFEDIFQCKLEIGNFGRSMLSSRGQKDVVSALVRLGQIILATQGEGQFKFHKGGYVELTTSLEEEIKFYKGIVNFDRLTLKNTSQNFFLTIQFNEEKISLRKDNVELLNTKVSLRFRGPLELAYSIEKGNLTHIPWYCEVMDITDFKNYSVVEAISPISNSSLRRVSSWSLGDNQRLFPSGYSLIDYENPTLMLYIQKVSRLSKCNYELLADWRHLINNYPVAKQKALKHQGGVSQYCHFRLSEIRSSFVNGNFKLIDIISKAETPETEYGMSLLYLTALLRYVWDVLHTDQHSINPENLKRLENSSIFSGGKPDLYMIKKRVNEFVMRSYIWRSKIHLNKDDLNSAFSDSMNISIGNLIEIYSRLDTPILLSQITERLEQLNQLDELGVLRLGARILEDEAREYYKLILALCSTILKSHLWSLWLMLDRDSIKKVCSDLLNKRTDDQLKTMVIKMWE